MAQTREYINRWGDGIKPTLRRYLIIDGVSEDEVHSYLQGFYANSKWRIYRDHGGKWTIETTQGVMTHVKAFCLGWLAHDKPGE